MKLLILALSTLIVSSSMLSAAPPSGKGKPSDTGKGRSASVRKDTTKGKSSSVRKDTAEGRATKRKDK